MSKITEIIGEKIISDYQKGVRVKDMVLKYRVSQQTINRYLNKKFVPKVHYIPSCKFDSTKEEMIIKYYKKGMSQKEIASLFGTYNTSIRRVLLRKGIIPKGNDIRQRLCKHNPFKNNDEYSEYFLGLLLTDGSISKEKSSSRNYGINLSLSEEDSYIVEAFRNWASPKSKLSRIYQKINGSYMYSTTITNIEMEEWLRRKGNFIRKSYECKIYTPITWNILRGIFDGDGGFSISGKHLNFFICGASKVFINQIAVFLKKNNITPHLREDKKRRVPLYYVEVYKINEVIKLGELMYNNAHIFIKRKYEKWLAFYESKRANGVNSGNETAI